MPFPYETTPRNKRDQRPRKSRASTTRRKPQSGAEIVEFLIVVVLIFFVFLLTFSMATTMFNQGTINAAARLAARQGAMYWRDPATTAGTPSIKEAMISTGLGYYINRVLIHAGGRDLDSWTSYDVPGATKSGGKWTNVLNATVVVNVQYPNGFLFDLNELSTFYGVPFVTGLPLNSSTIQITEGY